MIPATPIRGGYEVPSVSHTRALGQCVRDDIRTNDKSALLTPTKLYMANDVAHRYALPHTISMAAGRNEPHIDSRAYLRA